MLRLSMTIDGIDAGSGSLRRRLRLARASAIEDMRMVAARAMMIRLLTGMQFIGMCKGSKFRRKGW